MKPFGVVNMKKLLVSVLGVFLFLFVGVSFLSVQASNNINVTVTGIFDEYNEPATQGSYAYGSKLSMAPTVPSGHSFAFWIVNGVVQQNLVIDHEFTVTNRMNLQAVFAPNGKLAVVFIDSNGQYLGVRYVAENGAASDVGISAPARPGYQIANPKWASIQGSTDLGNIQLNSVFVLQYETDLSIGNKTLTVNGGTGSGSFAFNSVVTVTANTPTEGLEFSHWTENGVKVSNQTPFTFTLLTNRTLTAVFLEEAEDVLPFVTLSENLQLRVGYESYLGQYHVPAGYTVIEYGFLASKSSAELTIESAGVVVAQSNSRNAYFEFVTSFTDGQFRSIRAYLIVKNQSDVIQTPVYSDVFHRNPMPVAQQYNTGFESVSPLKGSYAPGNITSDGIVWRLDDALVGNLANDRKNGSYSVRIQNSGFIESQSAFEGLETISFYTAKYGTDGDANVFVYVSKDKTNWVNVTDAVFGGIPVTSTTLTKFDIVVTNSSTFNESGLSTNFLYVKIAKTGGTRVNIDDVSILSHLKAPIHEVFFDVDGDKSSELVIELNTISVTNPTKTGHTFAGWYLNPSFTGDAFDLNTPVTQSVELYAKFSIAQFTISFESNGGSSVSQITQDFESSVSAPTNPTKTGYSFVGWYSDVALTSSYVFDTMPGNNLTLYAKWNVNSYTISFNSNGGTDVDAITQGFGTSVSAPDEPTKEGYTFIRWYLTDPEVAYIFTTIPAENITLNALWVEVSSTEYTVSFETYDGSSVPNQNVIENQKATEPADPTWSGYDFDGWFTSDDFVTLYDFDSLVTGNFTLYAKWTQLHTVLFETNGGNSISSTQVRNGETLNPVPTPTRSGYDFDGWFTDEDLTNTFVTSNPITSSFSLYAKWVTAPLNMTLTQSNMNISGNSYNSGAERLATVNGYNYGSIYTLQSGSNIQGQASTMRIYNLTSLGRIHSIVITLTGASAHTLYGGITEKPTTNAITANVSGNTYTYNFGSNDYDFFNIHNNASAIYIVSIVVYYYPE